MEAKIESELNQYGISLREVSPVDITVRNISVTVEKTSSTRGVLQKILSRTSKIEHEESGISSVQLLENVYADMPRGSLTAIIGASGSGKTTLLNVLARRISERGMKISGSTTFNGSSELNVRYAYIMQQDCLIPSLTVRETLQYSAEIRLRDAANAEERNTIVEQTILELSLKECASTRIGTQIAKGCSGGEKRRTSIGIQLLQNPSVLFADEPTTGLDATSAHQVVQTLKDFAERGRTVVMTIHQPRSEIWELFDRVIIIAHGTCIYSGETGHCIPYFKSMGYEAPPFVNPAEFLIDLVAIDNRTAAKENAGLQRFNNLKSRWSERQIKDVATMHTNATFSVAKIFPKVSAWKQFSVMTRRSLLVSIRDPKGLTGLITQAVVVGITLGWTFYKLDNSLQGIRSRQGAFYAATAVPGYLMLVYEIYRCCDDVPIFDREYCEGVVHVIPYVLSRRAAKAFEDILVALVYSVIFYFMVGLRAGEAHFFVFLATMLLIQLTAVSVALFSVSIFRDFANAAMIGFAVFGYSNFGGGCFLPADRIPVYVSWVKWISYIFYAYGALNNNEFLGKIFPCQRPDGSTNLNCDQFSGAFQLRTSGISLKIWQEIIALVGLIAVFNIATGLVFFHFPVKIKMSKKRQSDFKRLTPFEDLIESNVEIGQEAIISLRQYSLVVQKLRPWGTVHERKSILKPFSTAFEPGRLNVIMGPSGSGKTSLLSSLAGRLQNSLTTRYEISGEVLVNDNTSTRSSITSMISLVTQDDDGLLPFLTVREYLRFAAALRLHGLSLEAKHQKAEDILSRLGLKDCANTLIGNEQIKGISGGEKRRVTIATQLLTQPRVLLLDEPTSGLDGFTANSILQLLTELAAEGRTIILTVHQNRADLFFTSNILLLARGGHVGYSGSGDSMLSHFRDAGYECPEHTNPGDFVLDLITIDLRNEAREAESGKRVERLILIWSESSREKEPLVTTTKISLNPKDDRVVMKTTASFATVFPILLQRSALNLWRERNAMIARIMNVVPYGFLVALFFAPLETDYQDVLTRLGLVQLYCFLYFMGTLNNTAHFPLERSVMNQEIKERSYTIVPFFVSFSLLELPFTVAASFLTALVSAFPLGIRSAEVFFALTIDIFALLSCGESLAWAVSSVLLDTGLTLGVTNMLIGVAQMMAGILSINMPTFLKAFNHISPITYVAGNLAPYFCRGVVFGCSPYEKQVDGNCIQVDGDDILRLYRLDHDPRTQIAILTAVVVGYRLFAFLTLYLRHRT